MVMRVFIFFFQAEDGIRDVAVTGVQTCALPISSEYKDLSAYKEIAIDLETRDDGINERLGAGWALGKGEIVGFAVAVEGWKGYFPFGHLGGGNMIPEQVKKYMKDVCAYLILKYFIMLSMM